MSMSTQADKNLNLNLNQKVNRNQDRQEGVLETVRVDSRTRTRCHLCGFAEVRTDEVVDGEILFLAECPRCENRWTSGVPIGSPLPPADPVRRVVRPVQRVPARVAQRVAPAA